MRLPWLLLLSVSATLALLGALAVLVPLCGRLALVRLLGFPLFLWGAGLLACLGTVGFVWAMCMRCVAFRQQ